MSFKSKLPIVLVALLAGRALAQASLFDIAIGDPARSMDSLEVGVDTIVDASRNETISPRELAARLSMSRLVLIGEEHTGAESHAVQLRVLQLLRDRGLELALGLEMIPVDRQDTLDAWVAGELDERTFLERVEWYRVWGYHWGYYRDIFLFARRHALPMIGLRGVRTGSSSETAPKATAPPSTDHGALVQAFFESDSPVHGGLTDAQLNALIAAQSDRDAAMASNVLAALRSYPERLLVVLAGTGHVLYELGIVRHLPEAERQRAATIVPVAVDEQAARARASVADYVWGVPEAAHPRFPALGVITVQTDAGLRVIHLESDSAAANGGVAVGDVITALDGASLNEKRDLSAALATLAWGDAATIELMRDGELQELEVFFRR